MYNLKHLLINTEYIADSELPSDFEITEVISDSKKITPGCLFVCLKGLRSNSHDFINEVVRRGAKVIVCDKYCSFKSESVIVIKVDDPRSVHSKLVSRMCGDPSRRMKMIAVTGTNGKTTVTHMVHSALNFLGKKTALIGTLGGFFNGDADSVGTMTTPDPELLYPLLKSYAERGAEYAVMEVSSHALALRKVDGLEFEVGAITNITPEHLDFHGDMESYTEAKERLFSMCNTGVFCVDDGYTSALALRVNCKNKLNCSVFRQDSNIFAADILYRGVDGCEFTVRHSDGGTRVCSKIPGSFTVSNALVAFGILTALGFTPAEASRGIASLTNVKGRMEVLPINEEFSVIIDFAHTPDALSKLLKSVRSMCTPEQRIVTLFGCGGDRDRSKRALMGTIAAQLSDFVIVTSDNSRNEEPEAIIDQIVSGINNNTPFISVCDRVKAIEMTILNAGKGDVILLCGKGHEEYEIDARGKRAFSEREIVFKALEKRRREGKS